MKKWIALLLTLALALSLCACGAKTEEPAAEETETACRPLSLRRQRRSAHGR
ncbi:MAG: hypothetical protein IJU12_02075 [Clostridia bacterium]|nr:hypothetical protein [Clostridia bacterium]